MNIQRKDVPVVATVRKWALCPECGAKTVIYDDTAECSGVWLKCTRGCRTCEFELIIHNGEQIIKPPEEKKK